MSLIPQSIRNRQKEALEAMYEDTCAVYEYLPVKGPDTKITRKEETLVCGEIPCKISFEDISPASKGDGAAEQSIKIKLFLSPDILIKAGSKVVVTHLGEDISYSCSGAPGKFPSHQEVELKLFERWA